MTDTTTIATTAGKHPATYTASIIDAFRDLIPTHVPAGYVVHDPFAGDGVKLAALCDQLGYSYTGTDLEAWAGHDERVVLGDSTDDGWYPIMPHAIVTSPSYNNGVNDHFEPKDTSRRLTYRVAAGHALHDNNTGRWSGRSSKRGEAEYWRITKAVVACWPDIALVNVKDSTRAGEVYPLTDKWRCLMFDHGYEVEQVDVACPGWRFGANGQDRADTEAILVCKRNPHPVVEVEGEVVVDGAEVMRSWLYGDGTPPVQMVASDDGVDW